MAVFEHFIGDWKVVACLPVSVSLDPRKLQGTVFHLNKTGDVTWKLPENAVPTPLFKCDTYEIVLGRPNIILRFGLYKGHIIDCTVTFSRLDDRIIRIDDGWCPFVCKKCKDGEEENPFDIPFSFLPALEDSFFSDLIIKASNNKEFHAHTCILKLGAPEIDWLSKPPPLSNLPEDVIKTILHYLYAQCLPPHSEENTIRQVISTASDMKKFDHLISLCHLYLKNLSLKNQIFSLVADMHTCASQIIDHFSNKNSNSSDLTSDPAKLCCAVKNSIREVAVAACKFLMLCNVYANHKYELFREDEHEIIVHAKSRIPVFMNQFERFLQAVKTTFSNLLPSQRQELACYLVPEVESILDTISSLLITIKTALEVMIVESDVDEETSSQKKVLEDYVDDVLRRKESSRLRWVIHRIIRILVHLNQKKESFKLMTSGNKIRSVSQNLEQLVEELPIILLKNEEFTMILEEKLQNNDSQFCFKVGTFKVSEIIKKLALHKDSLQDLLIEVCDLVQRDSFSQCLATLNLLNSSHSNSDNPPEVNTSDKSSQENSQHPNMDRSSVCVSPPANRNHLSKAANELLKSKQEADMIFEVISSGESDCVVDLTAEDKVELQTESSSPKIFKMEAHRVIIAARCDWFRRALLSGMQEDINRKIEVHNTSLHLFSLFLKYLYNGQLDISELSADQKAELLLLSDRYELDSLKRICEFGLKSNLDEDSVLYFLSMADRFNANTLKGACKQFIVQHTKILNQDLFEELPENLQYEIYEAVIYTKPQTTECNLDVLFPENSYAALDGVCPENDDILLPQDSAGLEAVLEQLRNVVGPDVSESQLVQVILAAEYDVNRALNFYYSSSSTIKSKLFVKSCKKFHE